MNFLAKGIISAARSCLTKSIEGNRSQLIRLCTPAVTQGNLVSNVNSYVGNLIQGFAQIRFGTTLARLHKYGPFKKKNKKRKALGGKPYAKAVVIKTLIKKPKKPNSANRKCVLVRLANGKELVAYVPGIGHNLQEHNIVLVREGRLQDTPGVRIKCIRGKYDLPHPVKRTN
ncbi:30S ribosomal protein S12 technical knockout [Megachile rotundata]|uniref:30S ribosomal protein S12 technical knockout n=1 Tax=Megachile rotundata TaxID=143995 RepID=UPI000258E83D|nr:PREDICTED: 40S ribosomal protein S12, mitochondrial isoform X1 [Megachile rotundata]